MSLAPVEELVAAVGRGELVIIVDDADRENEGDLLLAAELATPPKVGFMMRHTSGIICLSLVGERLDQLRLPMMVNDPTDLRNTAFTITIDAREGVTTGISAADRCRTILTVVDPATTPEDLTRPGHIFPLRYQDGGVLKRPGHTEAAVDLATLAGLYPAGALAEVVNDDGTVARLPDLERFAKEHGLLIGSIADLVAHRRRTDRLIERMVEARIPTSFGEFRAVGYRSLVDERRHVAMILGEIDGSEPVLVRVHSECLTGDVFASLRCDCGEQLELAFEKVSEAGRGVILYIRDHEGRGIGLFQKLAAYNLQDAGRDTVDANLELGLPVDARDYGVGAQILYDLGVREMRLLTNNPVKRAGIEGYGLSIVERIPLPTRSTPHNRVYLETKASRLGHRFDPDEEK
ncbi:MAG: bifunctional 3,4-dihydroxy-2-butanone-4-phosphate synthase/GTP cyclohydrolase II [Acidimicrobiia bacterium]